MTSRQRIDRNADRRRRIEHLGRRRFLRRQACDRNCAKGRADDVIGTNIEIGLDIAVGVASLRLSGHADQCPATGQIGNLHRGLRQGLDHIGHGSEKRVHARVTIHILAQAQPWSHSIASRPPPLRRVGGALVLDGPLNEVDPVG